MTTAILAVTLSFLGAPQEDRSPLVGKKAPDFTIQTMQGKKVKLSSMKGKVVFIDFWATWCPPCRATLPETQKFHTEYAKQGLQVMAVSDEDKPTIEKYLTKEKFTFPSFRDPENNAASAFNVGGIPTFVVVDRKGMVVDVMVGSGNEARVKKALSKAGLKL